MPVVPFRAKSAAAPEPQRPRTIEAMVNEAPGALQGLSDLAKDGLLRLDGELGEDGSAQVTYSPELEVKLRQLVARYGLPRLPFTLAELSALTAYGGYLESGRADQLPSKAMWQASAVKAAEMHHPGYAPGLRLFIAENLPGLIEHHRTACGYAELIRYEAEYY